MSSTTTETIVQPRPISTEVEHGDFLKDKIIEHVSKLTSDPDFRKASATYTRVKEQQEQIRIRDEELAKLKKDIEAQKEDELLALSRLSAVNQTLTVQKETAERKNASLQKEVTEKEKSLTEITRRIQELQRQIQTLLSERSQGERNMSSMIAQHNIDLNSLQRRLKERDASIDEMNATIAELKSLLSDEQTKSATLKAEKRSLDETIRKAHGRLEKFDAFILQSRQIDEQSIIGAFSGLWDYATNEIWTVLRQNLSDENLKNDKPWKAFKLHTDSALGDGTFQGRSVPLCASNSDAAKGMRLAVMLSILSREIDKEIFQPAYFPSDTGHFRMSLNKLAKSDIEKEHFFRSVLLSIDRDGQEDELQSRAQTVVENVSHYLHELLSIAQYDELKEKIKNVVDKAIEVWRPIQSSTKIYETEFDPVDWLHDEDFLFQFPVGDADLIRAEHPDDLLLVIFPELYSLESDGIILTSVVPLMSSQRLCVTANQELREKARGRFSPSAKQLSRKRQNSVAQAQSQPNGSIFLGGHSSEGSGN